MMSSLLQAHLTLLLKKGNTLYVTRIIHLVTVKLIRATHVAGVVLQDREGKVPHTRRVNISIPLSKELVKKNNKKI
jgi:hypothetical protein